jgi:hypothetical protein
MVRKAYSAGAVKHSFWFLEFRKMVLLLVEGYSMETIKQQSANENIFSAPTVERANQIYQTVSARVQSLDAGLYSVFTKADVTTQKVITLISVMNTDTLFFDFVYEVYREKLILGSEELLDSDIRVFFKNKQVQCKRVAGWRDYTLKRLGSNYKTFMVEAGIITRSSTVMSIVKPVLDISLEKCLIDKGMEQFIHALGAGR